MPTGVYKRTKYHKEICRKNTSFKKGCIPWNKDKKFPQYSGSNHWNWKGDKPKYLALHCWVANHKGKPQVCLFCGVTFKQRKLSWMNIDHTYRRNLDDFFSTCYSCHRKYDYKYNLKSNNKIGTNRFKEHTLRS